IPVLSSTYVEILSTNTSSYYSCRVPISVVPFSCPSVLQVWLDLLKPALKQIRREFFLMFSSLTFFPPDHTQLTEELTRYLFALQVKRDLACGRLICNDSSAALMVSHIIHVTETGDLDEAGSFQHLLHHKYHPDQEQLREQIQECQRDRVGQTPAESDYQLLEVARRLDLYGVRLHPATDREGTQLSLAVEHSGVLVLQVDPPRPSPGPAGRLSRPPRPSPGPAGRPTRPSPGPAGRPLHSTY
uniref:FERM domain-containing protein n=1 Tax=Salarias fasciatus TaxID=181472 RepID=A0A672JAH9_SALFA